MGDLERVYRRLLMLPGDQETMMVLADILEERGELDLADAYRWAAREGKWPFRRYRHGGSINTSISSREIVYDWESDTGSRAEECARLPHLMYQLMGYRDNNHERDYGGVNRAFKLLARFLPKYLETKP